MEDGAGEIANKLDVFYYRECLYPRLSVYQVYTRRGRISVHCGSQNHVHMYVPDTKLLYRPYIVCMQRVTNTSTEKSCFIHYVMC